MPRLHILLFSFFFTFVFCSGVGSRHEQISHLEYSLFDPFVKHGGLRIPPIADGALHDDVLSLRQHGVFDGTFSKRLANLGNTFRSQSSFVSPIIRNPNAVNGLLSTFGPCTSSDGRSGVCTNPISCRLYSGKLSSGSCGIGSVCCINTIATCSGTATLNNTYFESPATLNGPTACILTVKLGKRLPEQKFPICQIRLDFESFTIAQPAQGGDTVQLQAQATQCLTDFFQVSGTLNAVPKICGNNAGQHMYLHVPPSDKQSSDVKLTFNIGSPSISRSWKVKIAMLPCGATYLAPPDCLQYITSATGTVSSFNWADVSTTGKSVRQLANQNYAVCFRTEILEDNKRAKSICITECATSNGGDGFLLSGLTGATAQSGAAQCPNDFILFACALPPPPPPPAPTGPDFAERFCGNFFNPDFTKRSSVDMCTDAMPYELHYVTDGSEEFDSTNNVPKEENNTGFCFTFRQRSVGKRSLRSL